PIKFPEEPENKYYGSALKYFLVLLYWPLFHEEKVAFTDNQIFYNKYYWFLKYLRLREIQRGPDAGLEQQAFKMIEQPEIDVDWMIIEEIHERIQKELNQD